MKTYNKAKKKSDKALKTYKKKKTSKNKKAYNKLLKNTKSALKKYNTLNSKFSKSFDKYQGSINSYSNTVNFYISNLNAYGAAAENYIIAFNKSIVAEEKIKYLDWVINDCLDLVAYKFIGNTSIVDYNNLWEVRAEDWKNWYTDKIENGNYGPDEFYLMYDTYHDAYFTYFLNKLVEKSNYGSLVDNSTNSDEYNDLIGLNVKNALNSMSDYRAFENVFMNAYFGDADYGDVIVSYIDTLPLNSQKSFISNLESTVFDYLNNAFGGNFKDIFVEAREYADISAQEDALEAISHLI